MKKTTSVLLALALTFPFSTKAYANQTITTETIRPKNTPQTDIIKGQVVPINSDLFTISPSLPGIFIPRAFDVFVVQKTIRFIIFDSGTTDGDIVTVKLNGKVIPGGNLIPLTISGQVLSINPQAGTNVLEIAAISPGAISGTTIGIRLIRPDLLPGEPYEKGASINPGQSFVFALGYPQIGISRSRYPQSAKHMTDAWAGLPSEFRPANPIKSPRLLTIDRPGTSARRRYNIPASMPVCPNFHRNPNTGKSERDNRDEYPPATFKESADSTTGIKANIRCINAWDNKGSGASYSSQINNYVPRVGSSGIVLSDGSVVEFLASP